MFKKLLRFFWSHKFMTLRMILVFIVFPAFVASSIIINNLKFSLASMVLLPTLIVLLNAFLPEK